MINQWKQTVCGACLVFGLLSCSGKHSAQLVLKTDMRTALTKTGVVHRRLGFKAHLMAKKKQRPLISSALGEFSFTALDKTKTRIDLECPGPLYARALSRYIREVKPVSLMFPAKSVSSDDKSYLGMFGMHLLSPAFSSMYIAYNNPFSDQDAIWWRFLLHLGIDAAGSSLLATEGFSKEFRFNAGTAAFLILHRLLFLPSFVTEMDMYNRVVRAGFQVRF